MAQSLTQSYPAEPEALVINSEEGWILFDDDSTALIDIYIDAYGAETDDVAGNPAAVVARFADGPRIGKWVIIDLSFYVDKKVAFDGSDAGIDD